MGSLMPLARFRHCIRQERPPTGKSEMSKATRFVAQYLLGLSF